MDNRRITKQHQDLKNYKAGDWIKMNKSERELVWGKIQRNVIVITEEPTAHAWESRKLSKPTTCTSIGCIKGDDSNTIIDQAKCLIEKRNA